MPLCLTPHIAALSRAVTGRSESMFAGAMAACDDRLRAAIAGKRLLFAGGAGSIGSSTVVEALRFEPAEVLVIDPNENNLAELIRTIRSSSIRFEGQLHVEPLDYGSSLAASYLAKERPYDLVLSFAALKHVRSERDAWSLMRMLEVNLLGADRFMAALRKGGHGRDGVFMVSTDKAADPVSLMGASKRALEALLWAHAAPTSPASLVDGGSAPPLARVTTARFANVLYSDGSLPWAFLQRLEKRQPLAAPRRVNRYFVSPQEAGQLCLLAAACGPHGHVICPQMDPVKHTATFVDIAHATLSAAGLSAQVFSSEAEARAAVPEALTEGRYPLLLTEPNTAGEKLAEVFVGEGESAVDVGVVGLHGVPAVATPNGLSELLELIAAACSDPEAMPSLAHMVSALQRVVPALAHKDTGISLDDRM